MLHRTSSYMYRTSSPASVAESKDAYGIQAKRPQWKTLQLCRSRSRTLLFVWSCRSFSLCHSLAGYVHVLVILGCLQGFKRNRSGLCSSVDPQFLGCGRWKEVIVVCESALMAISGGGQSLAASCRVPPADANGPQWPAFRGHLT